MYFAPLYNVIRGIHEGRVLRINSGDSHNYRGSIDAYGKGHIMIMMNSELASILNSVGANVRYPHHAQTPDRSPCTRQRAEQISKAQVQSVQEYKDNYRKMIHDMLKD